MTAFTFVDEQLIPGDGRLKPRNPLVTEFAEALKLQPGQWAVYPVDHKMTTKYGIACNINHHAACGTKSLRYGFEAVVRKQVLYVRFVGDGGVAS